MNNKKMILVLGIAVIIIGILCGIVFLKDRNSNSNDVMPETTTQETTTEEEEDESIEVKEMDEDDGFGPLIPLN